jgi:hypothetical protein
MSPRATSTEEPDGGNLLVRIWRGAGMGNLPAYSTTAFSRRPPGRTPLVLTGDHRLRSSLERPATPHRAAWTGRSGWGRLKPQGFPRARASGRPVVAGRGRMTQGWHRRTRRIGRTVRPGKAGQRECIGIPNALFATAAARQGDAFRIFPPHSLVNFFLVY